LNLCSFTPLNYKLGLIKTLIGRAYKISNDTLTFRAEVYIVKHFLGKNAYPPNIVDKEIKTYIEKNHIKNNDTNNSEKGVFHTRNFYYWPIFKIHTKEYKVSL
jgi:hypothetical protein